MKIKNKQWSCFSMLLLLFVNCSDNALNESLLNTKNGVTVINNILKTEFNELNEISSLTISTKNSTSNAVDQISVTFNENNRNVLWFYSFDLQKLFKPELNKNDRKESKLSLKLSAFSTDAILTNFNKSVEMVNKQTTEFTNFKLSNYSMDADEQSKKIIHSFTLIATKEDNKTSFFGKRIKGNVFSFDFFTNNNGKLVCTNGLNVFKK